MPLACSAWRSTEDGAPVVRCTTQREHGEESRAADGLCGVAALRAVAPSQKPTSLALPPPCMQRRPTPPHSCPCHPQGRGSGVNFALPADMLAQIVPNLIVYGNALGKR